MEPRKKMEHSRDNVVAIFETLNEFRKAEKHCDVTFQVEDKSFRCHRLVLSAACQYFDLMFTSRFSEREETQITLHGPELNAVAFEEIVHFVYTGNCNLTSSNVYSVLRASDFLGLTRVEDLCITYIEENLPDETLDAFKFAVLTQKSLLKGILSKYIMENFDKCCNDDKFLELTFEDLTVLFSRRWYLPCKQETTLFDAITRWLNHSRKSRAQYAEQLMGHIRIERIIEMDTNFITLMMRKTLLGSDRSADVDYRTSQQQPTFKLKERLKAEIKPRIPKLSLHVYMHGLNRLMTVYSANKCDTASKCNTTKKCNTEWTTSCTMIFPCTHLKSIGLSIGSDSYLFCLDYSNATRQHTFRTCSSLDVSPNSGAYIKLDPPPVRMPRGFDLCSIRNNIYVNAWQEIHSSLLPNSVFSSEELQRGIYMYSIERDQWFPVPPVCEAKKGTMTLFSRDHTLYLLGRDTDRCSYSLQAFDERISKWQKLPSSIIEFDGEGSKPIHPCCAHQGSIYACRPGNLYHHVDAHGYDLTAGKWRQIESTSKIWQALYLVSYENWLWAFGINSSSNSSANGKKQKFECVVYDEYAREWIPAPVSGSFNLDAKGHANLSLQDVVVSKW